MTEAAQATFNMADRGYEVEVIENYQNALNCVICSLIINKSTYGCERHVFCESCIQEYITKSCQNAFPVCPGGCRKEIDPKKLAPNLAFDMLINKLKSKCSFKNCSWTGDLLDLVKDHRSQCSYATIKCLRNECGESFLKEDTEKHDNICLYKYLQCCYCENDVLRMNKEDHETSCAMEKVKCIYHEVGCNNVMCRRDVDKHEHDYQSLHMKLSFQNFKKNEKRLTQENVDMKKKLTEVVRDSTSEINQLKQQNNLLKQEVSKLNIEVAKTKQIYQIKQQNNELKHKVSQLNKEITTISLQMMDLKANKKRKMFVKVEQLIKSLEGCCPKYFEMDHSRIIIKSPWIISNPNFYRNDQHHLYDLIKSSNYYEMSDNIYSSAFVATRRINSNEDPLRLIPYHWYDFNGCNVSSNGNELVHHMITFPINRNEIEDFSCEYQNTIIQCISNVIKVKTNLKHLKVKIIIGDTEKDVKAGSEFRPYNLPTGNISVSGCIIIYSVEAASGHVPGNYQYPNYQYPPTPMDNGQSIF